MNTMTRLLLAIAFAVLLIGQPFAQTARVEEGKPMRIFLFSAKPSAKGWQLMKENPADRQTATAKAMERIGGRMLGYYFGLTDGRNYILAELPDGETAQALVVQRLASDLVVEYQAIELVDSANMPSMFKRLRELEAVDDSVPADGK